ncbi:hypothetical protein JTE90_016357 [Oedothorax gibbosus]|uniref:Uncharacterized protein n=1 Tax=Oedothorax gibbosus TaxID=931172 RepID=A0AAV6U742_9ARAC|nr:hypothetical protein JTE90_016357 [Oedothorax gibbosus]
MFRGKFVQKALFSIQQDEVFGKGSQGGGRLFPFAVLLGEHCFSRSSALLRLVKTGRSEQNNRTSGDGVESAGLPYYATRALGIASPTNGADVANVRQIY